MLIVVPDDNPPALAGTPALERMRKLGEVTLYDSDATDPAVLTERLQNAEVAVNIRGRTRFTDDVLAHCPKLKLIAIWGTGTDNVDLKAAAARGITVTNTPGANALAVAEHTIALMVAIVKQLAQADAAMRQGGWPRNLVPQIRGKRLGLIGTGMIGREVAAMAKGLKMEVAAWSFHPDQKFAIALGMHYIDLPELLRTSDIVSLHLRATTDTHHFLSRERLALLKPTAFVVNTARGALIDEAALVDCLREKKIAGAALDVFETEPLPAGHPLTTLSNVLLTSHCAGMTPDSNAIGLMMAAESIEKFLKGSPPHVVAGPKK
ncbi:MAG TPA: phosphoglycerate dehydrogenase [Candidatus Baltobacteraceae bacterium]|nr:phosphoglycerate dehydrogenase [Candidatus Baltobacteraceae bacterium]